MIGEITVFYNTNLVKPAHGGYLRVTKKFTIGVSNTSIRPEIDPTQFRKREVYENRSGKIYNFDGSSLSADQDTHLVVMYDNLQSHPYYSFLYNHPWQEIELPLPFKLEAKIFQNDNDRKDLIKKIQKALTDVLLAKAKTNHSEAPSEYGLFWSRKHQKNDTNTNPLLPKASGKCCPLPCFPL